MKKCREEIETKKEEELKKMEQRRKESDSKYKNFALSSSSSSSLTENEVKGMLFHKMVCLLFINSFFLSFSASTKSKSEKQI